MYCVASASARLLNDLLRNKRKILTAALKATSLPDGSMMAPFAVGSALITVSGSMVKLLSRSSNVSSC